MDESTLATELDAYTRQQAPPSRLTPDGLLAEAHRRRARRRRWGIGLAAGAVVLTVAGAGAAAGNRSPGRGVHRPPAGTASPAPPARVPLPTGEALTRYRQAFAGEVGRLAPGLTPVGGQYFFAGKAEQPFAFVVVDDGTGPCPAPGRDTRGLRRLEYDGRVWLRDGSGTAAVDLTVIGPSPCLPAGYQLAVLQSCRNITNQSCEERHGPHGENIVVTTDRERNRLDVTRTDGTGVVVTAATDVLLGKGDPLDGRATPPLTVDQLVTLATDPAFSLYR